MINKKNWYWWAGGAGGVLLLAATNSSKAATVSNAISDGATKAIDATKNFIAEAMNKRDFVKTFFPMAKEAERVTGVPALVTLAQAAIESGWGRAAHGNNFFGHKTGPNWKGERQLFTTTEFLAMTPDEAKKIFPEVISWEDTGNKRKVSIPGQKSGTRLMPVLRFRVKDWFRKYPTAKDAFIAHGNFLKNNKRYAAAFQTNNDKDFAAAIHKAGYATDPNYTSKLHKMIDDFKTLIA